MSDRYQNAEACGIEPEREGDEPTPDQWRKRCQYLWAENGRLTRSTAELRGALEVFGAVADAYARAHEQHVRNYADEGRTGAGPLSDGHRVSVALGDCRKARTALASSSTKET